MLSMLFLYAGTVICGQKVCTVANLKANTLYAGIENPMAISVSDIPNDHLNILLSDSLCRLEKTDDNHYLITPRTAGQLDITVMNVQNGTEELIGKYTFRVRNIPNPEIKLSGKKEGKISRQLILAAPFLMAGIDNFDFDVKFRVIRFILTMKHDTEHPLISESSQFTAEQLYAIKKMEPGQSFTLSGIIVSGPEGNKTLPDGATYTVE